MKNRSTWAKLLKRLKKHSFFIVLSLIMAAVTVATTLYVPILVGHGIDCIIGPDNVDFAKERQKLYATKVEMQRVIRQSSRFELFYENVRKEIETKGKSAGALSLLWQCRCSATGI